MNHKETPGLYRLDRYGNKILHTHAYSDNVKKKPNYKITFRDEILKGEDLVDTYLVESYKEYNL